MPEIGDTISLMPGHRAVFRGEYALGQPVYVTEIIELDPDTTQFKDMLDRLPEAGPIVDWTSEIGWRR